MHDGSRNSSSRSSCITPVLSRALTSLPAQTCFFLLCLQERATSSSWQAAFNAINILCGVGLLTTPYAMAISGLSSLLLLIGIGEDSTSGGSTHTLKPIVPTCTLKRVSTCPAGVGVLWMCQIA